jgi:chromosome segregation ATPase
MEFGPGLNIVTGPNGSGKSSLASAIVIGLGGSLSSLGRQKKHSNLVRRGSNSDANVKITIADNTKALLMHF